jgi:hypothetical protein
MAGSAVVIESLLAGNIVSSARSLGEKRRKRQHRCHDKNMHRNFLCSPYARRSDVPCRNRQLKKNAKNPAPFRAGSVRGH